MRFEIGFGACIYYCPGRTVSIVRQWALRVVCDRRSYIIDGAHILLDECVKVLIRLAYYARSKYNIQYRESGLLNLLPGAFNMLTSYSSGDLFESVAETARAPAGLSFVEDFLSVDEEAWLVGWIDRQEWLTALARRVQHYGWRYDYTRRRVSKTDYVGPVPPWARTLGGRLFDAGLLPVVPDQVIVNEYLGAQGIAAHVDSPSSFVGPIVTISLCETWQMAFKSLASGDVFAPMLPRRSALVLAGEARSAWTHEIARRTHEPSGLARGRRLSITLRTVAR